MSLDVYGLMMRECWENPTLGVDEVLDFGDGARDVSPASRYFDRSSGSPADSWCLTAADLGSSVVDVGCGAGRYSLELQAAHPQMDVMGIELSPGAAEVASERGLRTICADFRLWNATKRFDAILLLGNNIGLLGYEEALAERLRILRGWVRKGGVLVGTAGRANLLPLRLQGLVSPLSPGTFRARHVFGEFVGDWFEYSFLEPSYLARWIPGDAWKMEEQYNHEMRWAVRLRAI